MRNWKGAARIGAAVIAATACIASANAAVIVKDVTTTSDIPGIASFQTTGAEMTGMGVTANFTNFSETLSWGATGPNSGGVFGTGWSLTQTGDTFAGLWTFFISTDLSTQLTSMVLTGNPALTVFDTTSPAPGSDGSANGADFTITDGTLNGNATATYSDAVGIGGAAPLGDLFHVLTVTFAQGTGPRTTFTFRQDTDNDIRRGVVPEPGALALVGLALAAAGFARARRKSA